MEQVGAKAPALDLALEVAVRRGDHANVDAVEAVGADALDLAALQGAQELRLERERQLADLVEEEGPAVGHLELPGAVARGAGEGARHVAEQLALRDGLGQGGAVDVDEGLVPPRGERVDLVGDPLLADARLPGDEDREVGGRDRGDLLEEPPQRRARADDVAARLHGVPVELARHAPALLDAPLQRLDEGGGPHGGAGERAERREEARVEVVERVRLERVGGERADHLASLGERAAEAGVDVAERVRSLLEEAVEGVCERAVGGEAHRVGRPEDDVEARVLAAVEAAREGAREKPMPRQRHELVSLEPEQAGRVARDGAADRGEEASVPVAGGERGREVARDLEERRSGVLDRMLFIRQQRCVLHDGTVLYLS